MGGGRASSESGNILGQEQVANVLVVALCYDLQLLGCILRRDLSKFEPSNLERSLGTDRSSSYQASRANGVLVPKPKRAEIIIHTKNVHL